MGKLVIVVGLLLLYMTSLKAQGVPGVHPDASAFQLGIGYTFTGFHEFPKTISNDNGVTTSVVYYPDLDWIGAEAELTDVFGSQNGKTSRLLFVGGGVRFRWPNARDHSLQPWIDGKLGYSNFSPQSSFGNDSALGYKVGVGIDVNPWHRRVGYRISVDMIGSQFFGTYQLSPEASAGITFALGKAH